MRKRLIYRCDDVGYTKAYDEGLFRVIDANIGCSADVMFDAAHAKEALEWVKERPWLSVGWHRHLWERPVLPPVEVPNMVDAEGRFKWRHDRRTCGVGVTYEEAYKEFKAQMELCYTILGKYPDVAGSDPYSDLPMEKAFSDVLKECGIVTNFARSAPDHPLFFGRKEYVEPKYEGKNMISASISVGHQYDLRYWDEYQPIEALTRLVWTDADEIYFYGWHPGYCDDHILAESSCNLHRVRELQHAIGDAYKNWIIENHIELINFRDALYDSNEFQEHLRDVDSPLWVGNM